MLSRPEFLQHFEKAGVRFAYLFGSRARGQEHSESDFDFAVWYDPKLTTMEKFEQNCLLEEKLARELARPIDLLILNDARPTLQNEAVLRGKALYPDDLEAVVRFEAIIRQRYEDYQYSQRFFTAARRDRLGIA